MAANGPRGYQRGQEGPKGGSQGVAEGPGGPPRELHKVDSTTVMQFHKAQKGGLKEKHIKKPKVFEHS